ncbi:unnamed protein product [Bursaphelenchus okinawaensis]|uniref:legumain n=1 Tax=Bursaphelenchus okinawaensis TaxID=465554 RepID=A0A811LVJ0_9BILA|nr:unnamed protein product [Bursaphelenchus okinawaensis]CAG9128404.1 unnamed protein product [Bursaphelenchus okinawaensis]
MLTLTPILFLFFAVLNSVTASKTSEGQVWAVLVSGSCGLANYRHQADVLHAYQILREHRIPEEHIITMLCDDIVNAEYNPFPGGVFNSLESPDLYKTAKIDYRANDVTPANLLKLLRGEKVKEGGKVLNSTENDRVFIYYAGHGMIGSLAFSDATISDETMLQAKDFQAALKTMYNKKMYKRLVIYLEACYSGSMFDNKTLADHNIYAITAANDQESSYATNCIDVSGWATSNLCELCLGDEFSVNWMSFSDQATLTKETLDEQYLFTKENTLQSHVERFGNSEMTKDFIGYYQAWNEEKGEFRRL